MLGADIEEWPEKISLKKGDFFKILVESPSANVLGCTVSAFSLYMNLPHPHSGNWDLFSVAGSGYPPPPPPPPLSPNVELKKSSTLSG